MDNQRQAVLAYCAGLIDGEGCISIDRHKPKPGQQYPYYRASVAVSMCDPVQLLSETFGGVVWKQPGRGARRRTGGQLAEKTAHCASCCNCTRTCVSNAGMRRMPWTSS